MGRNHVGRPDAHGLDPGIAARASRWSWECAAESAGLAASHQLVSQAALSGDATYVRPIHRRRIEIDRCRACRIPARGAIHVHGQQTTSLSSPKRIVAESDTLSSFLEATCFHPRVVVERRFLGEGNAEADVGGLVLHELQHPSD